MKQTGTILVVDDSEATLEVLRRNLQAAGHRVHCAAGLEPALALLRHQPVDLVITDMKMPRGSGLDLVRHVRDNLKDVEVVVITGYPTVDGAVEAMKIGALDYLTKPFTDEELLAAVGRALHSVAARRAEPPPPTRAGLVGESPALAEVLSQVGRVARSRAPVLVTGESGTGKELIARAIHYSSSRAAAPFVPVNCGGIPAELAESELFGHVKGAFTGATSSRAGFFLTADGGTIFLDEIAETSPATQVKLLRVLQEAEVRMVGANRPRTVDVRVVAATNKDLGRLVAQGLFREDLYFRINVVHLALPPLRDRGDDVLLLARHFVTRFAAELGQDPPRLSLRAQEVLRRHSWPGNVRELQNVVQRMVVMSEGALIDVPDVPSHLRPGVPGGEDDLRRTLAEVEADYVRKVVASVGGNKSEAARILGIDRKTLRAKLPEE